MYVLDTDHLSLIQRNGREGKRILARLAIVAAVEVAVTVITYEEQVRGRLSVLSRARNLDEQISAYRGLQKLSNDYRSIMIVPFNLAAGLEHQRLRKAYPRLGNMDLKIAAIAVVNNATLLTRNLSDFSQIAGLKIENWAEI
ncbi:type II toxin-antitoxin system VapC family toxin [Romeria aff. gracilis LEGE 07310]|uniref:Type II toxin-antitoxin system VapC family toxin n=1 Tax=Vasconcelosia minhoensis LEGE 07310 TaxID=915328 RepID=A0A8J7ANN9_9CYAN|nr:type II toxin-antitoxin system VapC family toxin [Romeria gracilis]MBE9077814.1 type II toxin-antitoxin system VapC family toxin [Romeria aff. gracilis LEGE 07310]